MNEVIQLTRTEKSYQPGGSFLIQMLFQEPVSLPQQAEMAAVLSRHIGAVECFSHDGKMAGFSALDHMAQFEDGSMPVQLLVTGCNDFRGENFDTALKRQMWDCLEEREQILRECRYQVTAIDMLAGALPARERANLDMDFLEALAELYPTCTAFYFQNCGKLVSAQQVHSNPLSGPDRFIRFGVNARYFAIQDTGEQVVDTLGMGTLYLPDLQYHFEGMDPNWVVNHVYNLASYLLQQDNPIRSGETVDGVANGRISARLQWKCQYEEALIQPAREVLDVHMGEYAAGARL